MYSFGKFVSITRSLQFLTLKYFPDNISGDINTYNLLILYSEMCQYSEDLNNSVNLFQYANGSL